ncbi:MAG TPA: hypothetical protein VNN79_24895 [Actinomycetota bacterium]|nr:hypothetical protein [Actinomycetota bacterium]
MEASGGALGGWPDDRQPVADAVMVLDDEEEFRAGVRQGRAMTTADAIRLAVDGEQPATRS